MEEKRKTILRGLEVREERGEMRKGKGKGDEGGEEREMREGGWEGWRCNEEGKMEGMKKWRVERKEGEREMSNISYDIHSWQFRLCGLTFSHYMWPASITIG